MSKKIEKAQVRINQIKNELQALGEMRPGKVSLQKRKDRNGNLYGEYWQLGYTYKMKSCNYYVPTELVNTVKMQNETFKKFKLLTEEWIDLALLISHYEFELQKKELKKMG